MKNSKVKSLITMFSFIILFTSIITLFAQAPDYTPIMNQFTVQQVGLPINNRLHTMIDHKENA